MKRLQSLLDSILEETFILEINKLNIQVVKEIKSSAYFVKVSVGTMVKRFMKLLRLMELLVFLKIKLTIFRIEILIIT